MFKKITVALSPFAAMGVLAVQLLGIGPAEDALPKAQANPNCGNGLTIGVVFCQGGAQPIHNRPHPFPPPVWHPPVYVPPPPPPQQWRWSIDAVEGPAWAHGTTEFRGRWFWVPVERPQGAFLTESYGRVVWAAW